MLSNEELQQITSAQLLDVYIISMRLSIPLILWAANIDVFTKNIEKAHALPKAFTDAAPAQKFTYTDNKDNQVYFANYDMVQSEIRWIRNSGAYNPAEAAKVNLFNSYFGGGMGSIVFQTIRESKALAYSTYAYYLLLTGRKR